MASLRGAATSLALEGQASRGDVSGNADEQLAREVSRVGSYGFAIDVAIDSAAPARSLADRLASQHAPGHLHRIRLHRPQRPNPHPH